MRWLFFLLRKLFRVTQENRASTFVTTVSARANGSSSMWFPPCGNAHYERFSNANRGVSVQGTLCGGFFCLPFARSLDCALVRRTPDVFSRILELFLRGGGVWCPQATTVIVLRNILSAQ